MALRDITRYVRRIFIERGKRERADVGPECRGKVANEFDPAAAFRIPGVDYHCQGHFKEIWNYEGVHFGVQAVRCCEWSNGSLTNNWGVRMDGVASQPTINCVFASTLH